MHGSRIRIPSKNSRPYIYVKFLALLGAPYIHDISRLKVNLSVRFRNVVKAKSRAFCLRERDRRLGVPRGRSERLRKMPPHPVLNNISKIMNKNLQLISI
jgi:hypothetical protein